MMQIYTFAQLRNGTGFRREMRFVAVDDLDLCNTIGGARACIEEGIHEDRRFRIDILEQLNRLCDQLGLTRE